MPSQVIQDSRGNVYVTLYMPAAPAYQFDSSGRFVRRIGRVGGGPGEYRSAFLVQGSHDSLAILDYFNQRRSILAPGGTFVRTTPMPVASPLAVRLSSGRQIVSGAGGFSLVDNDGILLRSVGRPSAAGAGVTLSSIRSSHDDMFWAFNAGRYTMEQWRANGTKALVIERTSAFFPVVVKVNSGGDGTKPSAQLQEVYEDAKGVLWTISMVASTDWEKWLGPRTDRPGLLPYQKIRLDKFRDSVIEAFDVERGVLLQSTRVKGYFSHFLRDNVVAQHLEDEDGYSYLQLHRIDLIRK